MARCLAQNRLNKHDLSSKKYWLYYTLNNKEAKEFYLGSFLYVLLSKDNRSYCCKKKVSYPKDSLSEK
jgi:hypothetical protein